MAIHRSNWRVCLLSLASGIAVATSPADAFSSSGRRGKRPPSPKRGGAASFATTRRIFCFTLAGSSHTMFSSIRKCSAQSTAAAANRHRRPPSSQQSSSTSLDYRAVADDDWGHYCDVADRGDGSTDSMWLDALSPSSESSATTTFRRQDGSVGALPISPPEKEENDLMETAKAFIPVAVEIGVVAGMAANVHLN